MPSGWSLRSHRSGARRRRLLVRAAVIGLAAFLAVLPSQAAPPADASPLASPVTVGAPGLPRLGGDIHWAEMAKLLASDREELDDLGWSVAISHSGDVALLGAPNDDDNGGASGSAYVFRFDGSQWMEEAKLLPDDGFRGHQFGVSVALSAAGDVALVGAPFNDDNGDGSGSAYVFRFDGSQWSQEAKIIPADNAAGDVFGIHVAISPDGTIAFASATAADHLGGSSGAVYVFRFNGGQWVEEATILPSDGAGGQIFGSALAVSGAGDRLLVGAWGEANNTGSAYVFQFDGLDWIEEAKLVANDAAPGRWFGSSAALSDLGDVALIGAMFDFDNGPSSGSAYVFRLNGSQWSQEAKLLASDGDDDDRFGRSVALSASGDLALVGAPASDNPPSTGAVYVYRFDGLQWLEVTELLPGPPGGGSVGRSVSLTPTADRALVGAPGTFDQDIGGNTGAAFVFDGTKCSGVPGDLDGDGDVDIVDFSTFAACFGQPPVDQCVCADMDNDGDIDIVDFSTFAAQFGTGP